MKSVELTALVVAASLMVGGTYAWSAYSQELINETIDGTKAAGGRLHDDFNGENKDIYVENYTSTVDGEDIYARVRLREYFEYGEDAGDLTGTGSPSTLLRGDKQVSATPVITDIDTWDIYLYGSTPTMGIDTIRTFRDLEFAGSTVYMPTFNQDNTDLTPDINGTLAGLSGNGRVDMSESYTDYMTYSVGDTETGVLITAEDKSGISTTHTAKETLDSTIMTMEDWLSGGGESGNYWVYDTDGWAYWAQPIEPDTATGLLLDGIEVKNNTDERWYYAIGVTAQLATAGDWGDPEDTSGLTSGMHGDITNDGLGLLNKISGLLKVSSLVVTNNGASIPNTTFNLAYVENLNLIPEVTVEYGTGASYETEVEWSITEITGNSGVTLDSSIFDNGKFNPTEDMIGSTYEITVTSKLTPSRTITYTITVVDIPNIIEIATEDSVVDVRNTENLQLYTYEQGTTNPVSVTWSIVETSGTSGLSQEQINACLNESGVFTPDVNMAGCTYTVKATTPYDSIAPATKVISVYDDSSVNLTLLSAGNVSSMTLSPTKYELQMSVTIIGLIDKSVTWTVTDNGNSGLSQDALNACMSEDGLFSPTDDMAGGSYTVTATSKVDGSFYDSVTISITAPTIKIKNNNLSNQVSEVTIQLEVEIIGLKDHEISWDISGNKDTITVVSSDNVLYIGSEGGSTIIITATSVSYPFLSCSENIEIEYRIPGSTYKDLEEIVGTTTTVKSEDENGDDIEYYVLDAKSVTEYTEAGVSLGDKEAVLLFSANLVTIQGSIVSAINSSTVTAWSTSDMCKSTLPIWLNEQSNLKNRVIRIVVNTDGYYSDETAMSGNGDVYETTYNEAWLLSQPEFLYYIGLGDSRAAAEGAPRWFLRSPGDDRYMRNILTNGNEIWDNLVSTPFGIRPALWVVP